MSSRLPPAAAPLRDSEATRESGRGGAKDAREADEGGGEDEEEEPQGRRHRSRKKTEDDRLSVPPVSARSSRDVAAAPIDVNDSSAAAGTAGGVGTVTGESVGGVAALPSLPSLSALAESLLPRHPPDAVHPLQVGVCR